MDTVTLSKQNRLFWLGRYSERVYATTRHMMQQIDLLIDGRPVAYQDYCTRLGIPCIYTSDEDFCRRYLFDAGNPNSVLSAAEAMLGNGMVLRETLTTQTLAYLEMAHSAMEMAGRSEAPVVELQWVLDDLMAFRGSFDDTVEAESARNITKSGGMVERLRLMIRLGAPVDRTMRELRKLLNRLYKTDLTPDAAALAVVESRAVEEKAVPDAQLLTAVEGLFRP